MKQPTSPKPTPEQLREALRCWQEGIAAAQQEQLLRESFEQPANTLPDDLLPYQPLFQSLAAASGAAHNPPDFKAMLQRVSETTPEAFSDIRTMPSVSPNSGVTLFSSRPFLAAAALLLLCFGFIAGLYAERLSQPAEMHAMQHELQELRNLLMGGALAQASAFDRLQAVQATARLTDTGDPLLVVQLLAHSLNTDPNPQVRIAAADALYSLSELRLSRQVLLQSLENQRSELVLLHLIGILGQLQDEAAIPVLQQQLLNENLSAVTETLIRRILLELGFQPVHI